MAIQEVSTACTPQGTRTVIPPCWYEGLPAGWQVSLPQGPVLVAPFDDLGGLFTMPPFVLHLWHDKTSHRASLVSESYPPPTLPAP